MDAVQGFRDRAGSMHGSLCQLAKVSRLRAEAARDKVHAITVAIADRLAAAAPWLIASVTPPLMMAEAASILLRLYRGS
ncbi:MAG: hypothetical protein M0Z54_14220 [Thermaerobacter sp.]|nr:hypothetical protein [Thermaerobacter sp.]